MENRNSVRWESGHLVPDSAIEEFLGYVDANWETLSQGGLQAEQALDITISQQFDALFKFVDIKPIASSDQAYTWNTLVETEALKVGLLHLPVGGRIPAHDHPDTLGMSIVLEGSPEIIQADSGFESTPENKQLRPGDKTFIFPQRNNVHGFSNHDTPSTLISINISKPHSVTNKRWHFASDAISRLFNNKSKVALHGVFGLSLCAMSQASLANNCSIDNAMSDLEKNRFTSAVILLDQCASSGDASAQYALGNLYYSGKGVDQDFYTAAEWFHKAATQGNAEAQYMYGLMLIEGQGITDDAHEGFEWVFKSMMSGNLQAKQTYEYLLAHPEPLDC